MTSIYLSFLQIHLCHLPSGTLMSFRLGLNDDFSIVTHHLFFYPISWEMIKAIFGNREGEHGWSLKYLLIVKWIFLFSVLGVIMEVSFFMDKFSGRISCMGNSQYFRGLLPLSTSRGEMTSSHTCCLFIYLFIFAGNRKYLISSNNKTRKKKWLILSNRLVLSSIRWLNHTIK